MMYQWFL